MKRKIKYAPIKDVKVTLCPRMQFGASEDHFSRSEKGGLMNPYLVDHYNMGEAFSPSIEMMYESHASDGPEKREDIKERSYIYLFCKVSGKRWRIDVEK